MWVTLDEVEFIHFDFGSSGFRLPAKMKESKISIFSITTADVGLRP